MKSAVVTSSLLAVASARKCIELTIPITASARNGVFDVSVPANNIEVTDFILDLAQQGVNYTESVLNGVRENNISAPLELTK